MEDLKAKYYSLTKGDFFLENNIASVEGYLKLKGWIRIEETIKKIEIPGEGNMNCVLRIILFQGTSMILKQARPWVEKFPEIDAPLERIEVENLFYIDVNSNQFLAQFSPKVFGFDSINSILVLEDFGLAEDCSFVYKKGRAFDKKQLKDAVSYINHLKSNRVPEGYLLNLQLRQLNHQHIFVLPFIDDNDFDLDNIQSGLQNLSEVCKTDALLKNRIAQLGESYLTTGNSLLHGDFYPGSLLLVGDKIKVIDPEFSFIGPEEWDIAIFIAHLLLASIEENEIIEVYDEYKCSPDFDVARFSGFVGVEILRRLIGLAQLPLEMDLSKKKELLMRAVIWIKNDSIDFLDYERRN